MSPHAATTAFVLSILSGLILVACATPLERAEQRYRQGDRRSALKIWNGVPADSKYRAAAEQRVKAIEAERSQLVDRYLRRARYFERQQRLADSMLNYRLALRLKDDAPTLDHVQELARTLASLKKQHRGVFDEAFGAQNLPKARKALELLEKFDPFDPTLILKKSQFDAALQERVNADLTQGRRYFSDGLYTRAEDAFQSVLTLDPTNESARGYLAYISEIRKTERLTRKGHTKLTPPELSATEAEIRAEGLYQNALQSEQTNRPFRAIRYDLEALGQNAQHAEAKAQLARLRKQLAPELEPLIESGRKAFREEDLQLALDYWNKALLIEPSDARIQNYVARAEKLLEGLERLRTEPLPQVSTQ